MHDKKTWTLNLADALSGRAKLEGVQSVLLSATPRKALPDQLKTLLSAPNMLGPCRLRRARFKPGRKITAYRRQGGMIWPRCRPRHFARAWPHRSGN